MGWGMLFVSPPPTLPNERSGRMGFVFRAGRIFFIEDSALYDYLKMVQSDFMDIERDHYDIF